jgi:hypothetical protein
VSAHVRYTPGESAGVGVGDIAVRIPADFYTDPLDFEILTGNPTAWQACVGGDVTVLAPYAYRITNPVNKQRIGRFDHPVEVTITDQRLSTSARYWVTTSDDPPGIQASTDAVDLAGTSLKVPNSTARIGWFVTVPR